jgi:outer membrane protein assembly factor BamB
VQINAVCPLCKTSYQLPETMRGQAIRCPNPLCRNIFTAGNGQAPPSPSAPAPPADARPKRPSAKFQLSGSVCDLVPILPAEQAPPATPQQPLPVAPVIADASDNLPLIEAEPITNEQPELLEVVQPQAPDERPTILEPVREDHKKPAKQPPQPKVEPTPWQEAAPPARRVREPQPSTSPVAPPAPTLEAPQELPAGSWETAAPPVRRTDGDQPPALLEPPPATPPPVYDTYPVAPAKKKRGLVKLLSLCAAFLLLVGGGYGVYSFFHAKTEADLFAESMQEYEQGKFSLAAGRFKELQTKFPQSERKAEYAYLEKLSDLRGHLASPQLPPEQGLTEVEKFVADYKDDRFFKPRGRDLAQPAAKVMADAATTVPMGVQTQEMLDRIATLRKELADPDELGENGLTSEESALVDQALASAGINLARWQEEERVLVRLRGLPGERSPSDAIEEANRLLRLHKMGQHPEALQVMERLYTEHAKGVVYKKVNQELKVDETAPDYANILTVAPVKRSTATGDNGIVLALARGVLYALRRSDGQLQWWRRVGIDTATLPVRVPAKDPNPELFLVASADSKTLTALNESGKAVWEYHLGQPSRGRPLIVERAIDRLAYVPTLEGRIDVIELAKGQRLGYYDLKHRLSTGGVRQPGTDLLYFPADDDCVYVLNAKQERLERILYTGHDAGSLRGEPLIIAPDSAALARGEGYLLLNQTDGLHAMRLRLFALPLTDRFGPEADVNPVPRVAGWTWFSPSFDGEKVALLSDEGILGLFGVRQPGANDSLLYPRLSPGGVSLNDFLKPTATQVRSQVVQVQGNDFWVLAHGKLQHLQIAWGAAAGPRAVPVWPEAIPLGWPLHASQSFTERRGDRLQTTFFLVTQSLTEPSYRATAVDADTGRIMWQRQLGLVCRTTPLPLRLPGDDGEPVLLVLDQSGSLFAFDPQQRQANPGEHGVRVADPVDDNPDVQPVLLPAGDGQSAYEIAGPGNGKALLIRHVKLDKERQVRLVVEQRLELRSAPPHGTPALVGNLLVLPLADGSLARVPLPVTNKSLVLGDDYFWRSEDAAPETRGHVLALGPDRFVVTNGSRGFKVWQNNPNGSWTTVGDESEAVELENRIASAPVLLSLNNGAAEMCVADAAGVVWIVAVQPDGRLKVRRSWDVHGKVTAGPFLRTVGNQQRIGCVVDQRRLVWIDPQAPDIAWTYETRDKPIVGQPEVVGDVVVVADQAGRFVGLDPATGKADGPGYTLRGSIAPTTTPVGFAPTRLFVPLSDGTVILLPRHYFHKPDPRYPACRLRLCKFCLTAIPPSP